MKLKLLDIEGKKPETINVSDKVFNLKVNHKLIKYVVDWQLNHSKPRVAKTKQRNEIKGSTRKIYAQKGTGGARHSSRKAPLFVGGGMFGYFAVLPFGYDFFLGFENQFTLPSLRMGAYLSLTVKLLFAFGLIFELPTIIYILARMGLVEAEWLRQNRKYSLVIVFILAAILTPPDVVTQTLMAGPLIILYEVSIWIAKVASPNEKKTENQSESP